MNAIGAPVKLFCWLMTGETGRIFGWGLHRKDDTNISLPPGQPLFHKYILGLQVVGSAVNLVMGIRSRCALPCPFSFLLYLFVSVDLQSLQSFVVLGSFEEKMFCLKCQHQGRSGNDILAVLLLYQSPFFFLS